MNIYQKLMQVRVDLINSGIVKTGENKFTKAKYYQLEDFLPTAQGFMLKNKLAGFCSIKDAAKLTIVDCEKEDSKLEFELEFEKAVVKGAASIQNLGASITYLRRYLWMLALEITESDAIDEQGNDDTKKEAVDMDKYKEENKATLDPERKHLCKSCRSEISEDQARETIEKYNAKICESCDDKETKTAAIFSNILKKFEINDFLVDLISWLQNNFTDETKTLSYFDYSIKNGGHESLVVRYFKDIIKFAHSDKYEQVKNFTKVDHIIPFYKTFK